MATTPKTIVFDIDDEDIHAAYWACIFGTLVIKHEYEVRTELPPKYEFWQVKSFAYCQDQTVSTPQLILWCEKFF